MSTIILLHGMTGTPVEMAGIATVLSARGHKVILPELPGHSGGIGKLRVTHTDAYLKFAEEILIKLVNESREPVSLCGLSFGAILALYLSSSLPAIVGKVALLSVPIRFRSFMREELLTFLSLLPESVLDLLPAVQKQKRAVGYLAKQHICLPQHSIGAAARLVKIRRKILSNLRSVGSPLLVLQDPKDHHLSIDGVAELRKLAVNTTISVEWMRGGEHELPLGHMCQAVENRIVSFFDQK